MTTTRERPRAAGYIRVSDESQVEGHSLDAQKAEITRWCQRQGYEVVVWYRDEGKSAYTDRIEKRPEFARLLLDAEAGLFDITVVHTVDRWARRISVQAQSLERLGRAGVGFASVVEQIDYTTPVGQMVLTMLGATSQFFSAQTGVHVRKSHLHKASLGLAVGPLPFAYRRDEEGAVIAVPEEATAVSESFDLRLAGASYGQIAERLNAAGFRTRTSRRFTSHAVKDMLACRFYAGVVRCGADEFQGKHETIVSQAVFEQVQGLRHRRNGARLVRGERGILQGRIGCIRCGSPLHSDRQHRTGRPMYRERHGLDCESNNQACMADPIDRQLGEIFKALAIPPDWRDRVVALAAKRGSKRGDVAVLGQRRQRVMEVYEDGGYSAAEYKARLADIDRQLRNTQPAPQLRVEQCMALLQDLDALWGEATAEERSRLVAPLIDRVWVDVREKCLCAITPAEGFEALLREVLEQPDQSACFLLPAEVADQPGWWTWWRRGRIELPVQAPRALSLLQAYPTVRSRPVRPPWDRPSGASR